MDTNNANNCGCCSGCGDWLYSVFRIIVGGLFLWHGILKFVAGPSTIAGFISVAPWLVWLAAIIETLGGALILVGFFTRYAAIAGILDMLGAWLLFHIHTKGGWNPMSNGGEAVVLYFAAFLVLHQQGSGSFSIGALFNRGSCECDCDDHEGSHDHAPVMAAPTAVPTKKATSKAAAKKSKK